MSFAYLDETRAAQCAKLDSMILSRMNRIRERLRTLPERLRGQELVILVGPRFDRGIEISVITAEEAKQRPIISELVFPTVEPGRLLVFAWNHSGFSAFRTVDPRMHLQNDSPGGAP